MFNIISGLNSLIGYLYCLFVSLFLIFILFDSSDRLSWFNPNCTLNLCTFLSFNSDSVNAWYHPSLSPSHSESTRSITALYKFYYVLNMHVCLTWLPSMIRLSSSVSFHNSRLIASLCCWEVCRSSGDDGSTSSWRTRVFETASCRRSLQCVGTSATVSCVSSTVSLCEVSAAHCTQSLTPAADASSWWRRRWWWWCL